MSKAIGKLAIMGLDRLQGALAGIDAAREAIDLNDPSVVELSFLAEALRAADGQARATVARLQIRDALKGDRHAPR